MTEEILKYLYGERCEYKGTVIMKQLINGNENFRNLILNGIKTGKISGFDDELWQKIDNQNIRRIPSFLDVFKDGANLGYCTVATKQLSYSFPNNCLIAGGEVDYLKGTVNSPNGEHTWLVCDGKVYDTTFMLIIDLEYSKEMGYKEENIYNPNLDLIYLTAKDFTNDVNLRKKR